MASDGLKGLSREAQAEIKGWQEWRQEAASQPVQFNEAWTSFSKRFATVQQLYGTLQQESSLPRAEFDEKLSLDKYRILWREMVAEYNTQVKTLQDKLSLMEMRMKAIELLSLEDVVAWMGYIEQPHWAGSLLSAGVDGRKLKAITAEELLARCGISVPADVAQIIQERDLLASTYAMHSEDKQDTTAHTPVLPLGDLSALQPKFLDIKSLESLGKPEA
eukprot:gene11485-2089_t